IGYIEIYNEQLYDLLSPVPLSNATEFSSGLSIYDDRGDVFVKGLTYQMCSCEEEALNLLFEGETNRSIGAHILNKVSSRSHCIFTIRVESKPISSSSDKYTLSKLNLVDLAGSERLAKTQSQGITQKEAQYINKSLSFLEQAVIGLSDSRKPFVQFRQSKLTHLLKDSIGGNCMTRMIANIWPEGRHMEETVSTLRFASRMMNVTVEPAVNEIIDPMRMMQKLDSEVKMLRQELAMHDTLTNTKNHSYEPLSEHQLYEIENQCRRYIEGSLEEIEVVNVRQIRATFSAFKRICKVMEKDVEQRLREKYALFDKNDMDQINEAQKAGYSMVDDSSLVGDTDGQGFGVGYAGKDSRVSKSDLLKLTKKNRLKANNKSSSPVPDAKSSTKAAGKDFAEALKKDSGSLTQTSKDFQRLSTPPTKNAAFEEFKAERGNEINRIWNENKAAGLDKIYNIMLQNLSIHTLNQILYLFKTCIEQGNFPDQWKVSKATMIPKTRNGRFNTANYRPISVTSCLDILSSKRRQYSDLAHKINETKSLIDHTKAEVERKRSERYSLGEFVNEIGETVIDEEEFALIKKLQDLKSRYRDDFDRWRELKAEIVYCQNLVEQCRQRLIQEFIDDVEDDNAQDLNAFISGDESNIHDLDLDNFEDDEDNSDTEMA
ncbi:kinesin KIF9, partial [Brachionus plicatilis]